MDAHEQKEKELADDVERTRTAKNLKATKQNIEAFHAAEKALKAYRAELEAEANPEARRFSNPLEITAYLVGAGWKVSKSKVYEDRNIIKRDADGKYTKKAVDEYAEEIARLERQDGTGTESGEAKRKAKIEADIADQKLKALKRENEIEEGKWVLRSEAEQKHTAKLALLMTATDNFFSGGKIDEAVELVGGAREKAADFRAFLKKEFRAMLGEYAKRPEFTVPVQAMTEAEEMIKENEA